MIITIVLIMMLGVTVNAETSNTFKANLTATNTTIKSGEYVTVTLKVSDINMGDNGINALEGTIKYDTTIFEEIKSTDIQSYNNWATTYNDENSNMNGKFLAVNLSAGIKEDTKILSIKLKAKESITETKETTITIQDIESNNGTDLINVGSKSIKIKVEVEKKETEKPKDETTNKTEQPKNETVNKITQNTSKSNTTNSNTKLPATGIEDTIAMLIVVVLIATVGLGMKCRKWRGLK